MRLPANIRRDNRILNLKPRAGGRVFLLVLDLEDQKVTAFLYICKLDPQPMLDDFSIGPACNRISPHQHAHDRKERSDPAGGGSADKNRAEDGNDHHPAIGIKESTGAPEMTCP